MKNMTNEKNCIFIIKYAKQLISSALANEMGCTLSSRREEELLSLPTWPESVCAVVSTRRSLP